MSTFQNTCNADFRNEGWAFTGTGVSQLWQALSAIGDDTKYVSCPANKGRGCVQFPVDISSSSVPDGAAITSVTVYIRCKKTDTSNRSVTVNLMCLDDTSRFTSRTIYPTTTITTFELGTYTTDCLGFPWTKDRLNRLMLQIFSYAGIFDIIRCYELYCVINYRNRPTVTIQNPTGTVSTPSPTVSWTYAQSDGDPQEYAEYKIFTAAQQEASAFDPERSHPTYANIVLGDVQSFTLPTALASDDYYIYVRVASIFHGKSVWVNRTFTVQGGSPGVPGGTSGGETSGGGAGFVSVIGDSTTSSVNASIQDGSNLLCAQDASFGLTPDSLGYTTSNCTKAVDQTRSYDIGMSSMQITASSAATMNVTSGWIQVAPGVNVTAHSGFLAVATGRTCTLRVLFFDDSFNSVSGTLTGSITDSTSTWTDATCTGLTPSNCTYAQVQLEVASPANAEAHNIDGVGLMYGSGSVWSFGGMNGRNLLSGVASRAADAVVAQSEGWAATSIATAYARVASTGTGAGVDKQFKLTYNGITPTISFVAAGTVFTTTSTGTGYTLNKPAGIVDADLYVAYVASDTGGTPIVPSGWELQNTVQTGSGGLSILTKDALAADPSTWTGNMSSSATRIRAVVLGYRGAAPSVSQFLVDNVNSNTSGTLHASTPSINNTDGNGWRLSAFANINATGGTSIANIVPPSPPGISFVSAAATWTSNASSSSYTINKPGALLAADLMIASVVVKGTVTVTAPSGWTVVHQVSKTDPNGVADCTIAVLKRTAGASESSSWSGTLSGATRGVVTEVSAYRNCADASSQFIAENTSTAVNASSITTASVTNTNSGAWRVSVFGTTDPNNRTGGFFTPAPAPSMTSNETIKRSNDYISYNPGSSSTDYVVSNGMFDSNGAVTTGSYTRTGTLNASFLAADSWIGLILPLPSSPAAGANETRRVEGTTGGSTPEITLSVFDTAGVAATGSISVTQQFTPTSGTTVTATADWIGILSPLAPTVFGEAGATLTNYVDISKVSADVLTRAGGAMTVMSSFLGSSGGTPYLVLYQYTGNELISTQVAQGASFNTSTWINSVVQFALLPATTRIKVGIKIPGRAVSDIVYFNRVSAAFGTGTTFHPGTGAAAHPVYDVPLIEYAEDAGEGYGDWLPLPGLQRAVLSYDQLFGLCTFVDESIVPLRPRKYRARTLSYGLNGDTFLSRYGPESLEVIMSADQWWLKDLGNPDNSMAIRVKADPVAVKTATTAASFQPLGRSRPIVVSDGYKGDAIDLTIVCNHDESVQLSNILNSGRTMYLQSNTDKSWWVRPTSDITSEMQVTSKMSTNPIRFVKVSFIEVDPEL